MATCYLDVDDEITGAIARIRDVTDGQAILVLPAGSRIATSRINFRLLAREASERGIDIVVVSDEAGARALAISAGVPAYDSVVGAEAALAQFLRQDSRLADRTGHLDAPAGRAVPDGTRVLATPPDQATPRPAGEAGREVPVPAPPERTRVAGVPPASSSGRSGREDGAAVAATAGVADGRSRPAGRAVGRRLRLGPLLALGLLLVLLAGAAYGAYMLLPTATISLRPHFEQVGPTEMNVVADPSVAVSDPAAGVISAQRLEVPLSVSGTFPATGSDVSQSRATGTVRFRSENTLFEVPIPAGTRVSTEAGVVFETTEAATLEAASFASGPTTVQVPIRAVRAGPRSNVEADSITQLPESLSAALVSVRNPRATTGGRRQEETVIAEEDYDAALETLVGRIPAELRRMLADPSTTPRGLTVFPASARTGAPEADLSRADLVAAPLEEFSLTVQATATVLAVNESLVDDLARQRLTAEVPAGATVHGEGFSSQRSAGRVLGNTILYRVSASVLTYRLPDRDTILEQVRGVSISEAEAIMARYGDAELSVWPEFIDRVPDQLSRINLTILPPQESP